MSNFNSQALQQIRMIAAALAGEQDRGMLFTDAALEGLDPDEVLTDAHIVGVIGPDALEPSTLPPPTGNLEDDLIALLNHIRSSLTSRVFGVQLSSGDPNYALSSRYVGDLAVDVTHTPHPVLYYSPVQGPNDQWILICCGTADEDTDTGSAPGGGGTSGSGGSGGSGY